MGLNFTPELIRDGVVQIIILILSIAVHEFGHAIVADRLGDRLPRSQGRVTLNPIAHADPLGTIALPALGFFLSGGAGLGFGWGRPVQVNPVAFSRRFSMTTGHMLVAAAGPAMNLFFGLFISIVAFILLKAGVFSAENPTSVEIYGKLQWAVMLNLGLMFFNLIPAPPLDGGAVLEGLLPRRAREVYQEYAKYGIFVLIAFFVIPQFRMVIVWPAMQVYKLWTYKVLGAFL